MSENDLFGDARLPVMVVDVTNSQATPRVFAESMKFIFVIDGWAKIVHDNGEFLVEPGSVLILPERIWAQGFPIGFARTITFYVQADFVRLHLQWLPRDDHMIHRIFLRPMSSGEPSLLQLERRALWALRPKLLQLHALQAAQVSALMTLSRVAELFNDLLHFSSLGQGGTFERTVSGSRMPRSQVVAAVQHVHQRIDYPWTVGELSRLVAMSPSQLTRLFRQDLGVSPAAFVWNARAERMAEILAASDTSVSEAAQATGWATLSTAVRGFKRRYGVTPRPFALTLRSLGLAEAGAWET